MGKRIVALFSVLILLFSAVIWRLSWLSRKEDFAQAANQQSTYTLEVSQSRGMIYDCQGQSLVNDSFHYMAAVLPNNESAAALRSQFASADLWREKMNSRVPFLTEVNTDCLLYTSVLCNACVSSRHDPRKSWSNYQYFIHMGRLWSLL